MPQVNFPCRTNVVFVQLVEFWNNNICVYVQNPSHSNGIGSEPNELKIIDFTLCDTYLIWRDELCDPETKKMGRKRETIIICLSKCR